jgi:hypothetical protein
MRRTLSVKPASKPEVKAALSSELGLSAEVKTGVRLGNVPQLNRRSTGEKSLQEKSIFCSTSTF